MSNVILHLPTDDHHKKIVEDYVKHGLYIRVENEDGLVKLDITEKGKRIGEAMREFMLTGASQEQIDAEYNKLKETE